MPAHSDFTGAVQVAQAPAPVQLFDVPQLMVLVATEEEFDWSGPFDPQATSTLAIDHLGRAQELFDAYGIRPTYALDYAVADQRGDVFRELYETGRAEIGAHLHPWVNPPRFEGEDQSRQISFPGNLPPDVERAKLKALTERIEETTGARPKVYQAGRFGFGDATAAALLELGYQVDSSAAPPYDYTSEGGPNYSATGSSPTWLDPEGRLLSIPVTGGFAGWLGGLGPGVYRHLAGSAPTWLKPVALAARTRMVERLRLSPEGHGASDLIRLSRSLYAAGERVFTFYFHSPSLQPGCTDYVQSEADLRQFLESFGRYFEFFLGEFGGEPSTQSQVYERYRSA